LVTQLAATARSLILPQAEMQACPSLPQRIGAARGLSQAISETAVAIKRQRIWRCIGSQSAASGQAWCNYG
jgi:hypothetical protein